VASAESGVKIWAEPLTLPTYEVAEPDSNPMFFKGEVYQGASKFVYPYPFLDNLTDNRVDKTYNAVYLENEYIKLSFLPELGGRLFSALDKTNDYDYLYKQEVIKPALIGMLGAWISGGVEWCVVHHHRNTTFMPVDYTLVENADGSKTLWFGETEWRHRARWVIGATLYPGKSYMQITVKIFNRTAQTYSFLYWANVAVHANNDYQVIFPPSVDYAVYHAKNQFVHWPIGHSTYRRVDYEGVDLSWWKNHPQPVSFFAWDMKEDFAGGYDHGKEAGVVSIVNRHISPSAKLWEFSPGPRGKMWDKILADNAEPYAELMVGGYSDNQPDYSWIKPYEVKTVIQYWYPARDIGGFRNANLDAAVNLELTDDGFAEFGFNTTSKYEEAKVLLKAQGKTLYERTVTIAPDKAFSEKVKAPEGTKEADLEAILLAADGKEIISYQPVEESFNPELPPVVEPPAEPKDVETVEELYLIGQRIQQFYNPTIDPYPYYEEALRRDAGDSRVNTALGIDYNKRAMFAEAEKKLQTAVERIGKDYTRPRNCEAYYQLGIAQRAQGKNDDAYKNFYRATWDYAFHSAGYYQLAEMSCEKGDLAEALRLIDNSLSTNQLNNQAKYLKVAVLRNLKRFEDAKKLAGEILTDDPINFTAQNELYLMEKTAGDKEDANAMPEVLTKQMRDDPQAYLELAADYINAGLLNDAVDVLSRAVEMRREPLSSFPMIHYYLGYLFERTADRANADKHFALAEKMPAELCFPFRFESIKVLKAAIARNPNDARAYYYLGNLLYNHQPDNAIDLWEKSRRLDASFATVHRNLGWAYYRAENDIPRAIASYEKAVACNSKDARVLAEFDMLREIGGVEPAKRLALLEENLGTARQRDDSYLQLVSSLVLVGKYDEAIEHLKTNHFNAWEGSGQIRDVYVDAHLLRGRQKYDAGDYKGALEDFLAAAETPENLEIGRLEEDKHVCAINYSISSACEGLGESEKAQEHYKQAAEQARAERWPHAQWFQGLALVETGQGEKANEIFDELIETGRKKLTEDATMDFFAKFGESQTKQMRLAEAHFTAALGYQGRGEYEEAKGEFEKAVGLNPNHLWARVHLAVLERQQEHKISRP